MRFTNHTAFCHHLLNTYCLCFGLGAIAMAPMAQAQTISPELLEQSEQIEDQSRRDQEALRERALSPLMETSDIRTDVSSGDAQSYQEDQRCFDIQEVRIKEILNDSYSGDSAQPDIKPLSGRWFWLAQIADAQMPACLGINAIQALQAELNQALIEQGYITSKVAIREQDLKSQILNLHLIPGYIEQITAPEAMIPQRQAVDFNMPFGLSRDGDQLYNQGRVDQALEHIRRLPSWNQTTMEIVPSDKLGGSVIKLSHPQDRQSGFNGSFTVDNSGGGASDKLNLSAALSLDTPFGRYDQLRLSLNSDGEPFEVQDYNRGASLQWSMPYGDWMFRLKAAQSRYKATRQGSFAPIVYTGVSRSYGLGADYTLHRDADSKTRLTSDLNRRASRNFINDNEIGVQRRHVTEAGFGLHHTQYFSNTTVNMDLSYNQSIVARSDFPDRVAGQAHWDGEYKTLNAHLGVKHQFKFQGQPFRLNSELSAQANVGEILPVGKMLSLGSRSTVRGFDERRRIQGADGYYMRNELSTSLNDSHEVFAGIDGGQVFNADFDIGENEYVVGGFAGLRGRIGEDLSYSLTYGTPINSNDAFESDQFNLYGQMSYRF